MFLVQSKSQCLQENDILTKSNGSKANNPVRLLVRLQLVIIELTDLSTQGQIPKTEGKQQHGYSMLKTACCCLGQKKALNQASTYYHATIPEC